MQRLSLIAALLIAVPAASQTQAPMDHSKMSGMGNAATPGMDMHAMMRNTTANPYAESSMQMHQSMMTAMGGDASETWTRKMIEHHRGAIAMSDIAVAKAADKETRTMAAKSARMQRAEVAELQGWLARHGKTAQ
jgi:uncharacterized protein (DUF305 family)